MENLIINATMNTPEIFFSVNGDLKIAGKLYTENAVKYFERLINWVKNFEGTSLNFDISLEYINTSSSMLLFKLLKLVDEDSNITDVSVFWSYDVDDEDHLDTGEFFEERLDKVNFEYCVLNAA